MPAHVGDYELVERIAVGGMAEVFLARKAGPEGFEKRVALKRILPHLGRDPEFVAMFLDEARLAARLTHPHVVQVYDFGLDGDRYFLTMEYVAGADLQAVIRRAAERRAPIAPACAAALLIQACEALHHAHEQGVVHRDVTPANLLVSYGGVVKLADFGIAHAESRAARTQAGALKGKIPYMSPEQASGRAVDRRTDVYSLGVCGWELLSGRRLHGAGGSDELATLARVQAGRVQPLRAARRDVPEPLAAIVERALARDPDARWPTARALGEALGAWLAASAGAPSSARLADYMSDLFGQNAAERAIAPIPAGEPTAPIAPGRPLPARALEPKSTPDRAGKILATPDRSAKILATPDRSAKVLAAPDLASKLSELLPGANFSTVARRWVAPTIGWFWPLPRLPVRLPPLGLGLRARLAPLRLPRLRVALALLALLALAGLFFFALHAPRPPEASPPHRNAPAPAAGARV